MADKLGTDSVSQGLLAALREDEDSVINAYDEYAQARTNLQVVTGRYTAMREAVRARLGASPYSKKVYRESGLGGTRHNYRYRFIGMQVGDAVIEVLEDNGEPMTLDAIHSQLSGGGLYFRDTRPVNAALIHLKGVHKSDDGLYSYQPEEEAPYEHDPVDDLPF